MAFTFVSFSCQQEEDEVVKELLFPAVTSVETTDLKAYPDFANFTSGRNITSAYDWNNATTVTYDGVNDMEFIFVPYTNNPDIYVVFAAQNGQTAQLPLSFKNTPNSLIVSSDEGSSTYEFDGNSLVNLDVQSNSSFGRTECFATGFIDCHNRLQDELRSLVGDTATFVIDVGCAYFVWCRASYTIACSVAGIANCDLFT